MNGHLEAAKLLVEQGADVAVENHAGHDALSEAVLNDRDELAAWLMERAKSAEASGSEVVQLEGQEEEEKEGKQREDEESNNDELGGKGILPDQVGRVADDMGSLRVEAE